MNCARNQVIVLTPPAPAAIAVVRLIGPDVTPFLRRHFSKDARVGRCVHGNLTDGDRVIDDPVVVLLPDDGGADVNLHGGPWVVRSMLDLAAKSGFEIVEPVNGVLPLEACEGTTVIEREIAAHLPLAKTELGMRVLLAQAKAWEPLISGSPAREEVLGVLADHSLWHLLHPPTVAIVGAPNVGKSTLANQLFGQERSITADLPGTTRDWVGEIANIDGLPILLVDTPGLRTTDDEIERTAIERSRARVKESELVVLVLDATRPLEPEQGPLLSAYPNAIRVVNKSDLPRAAGFVGSAPRTAFPEGRDSAGDEDFLWHGFPTRVFSGETRVGNPCHKVIPKLDADSPRIAQVDSIAIQTVATTGEGIGTLRHAIAAHFGCAEIDPSRPRWWTDRQKQILAGLM